MIWQRGAPLGEKERTLNAKHVPATVVPTTTFPNSVREAHFTTAPNALSVEPVPSTIIKKQSVMAGRAGIQPSVWSAR